LIICVQLNDSVGCFSCTAWNGRATSELLVSKVMEKSYCCLTGVKPRVPVSVLKD